MEHQQKQVKEIPNAFVGLSKDAVAAWLASDITQRAKELLLAQERDCANAILDIAANQPNSVGTIGERITRFGGGLSALVSARGIYEEATRYVDGK